MSSINIRSFSGQESYCCRYLNLKYFSTYSVSVFSQALTDRTDRTGSSSIFVLGNTFKEGDVTVSHRHEGSLWYIHMHV